ncbi:hypothetical protein [Rubrivirga litoralis]|uniref:Uncharacterized protein n=1 Tax=Rubrivirga litoralis TaxID=3075598 RepID=A0ABU3BUF5_9BACT|nr:hypothetical protein [Rubrivirga sp. F394]MDT0632927.1 hypothetical protein [Rubrivirga sp. F394]
MPQSLRSRLANAARSHSMRQAHAAARALRAEYPRETYAACLRVAMREVAARVPRCSTRELCRQAAAWAACARATGARFDVEQKAADAVRFSADCNLASLAVPSKLVGTASYQDAAAAVASRLDAQDRWHVCQRDRAAVFGLGLRLGQVQPKHANTWLPALDNPRPVRVAVIAVTGGEPVVGRGGRLVRKTRGVNVAVEVGAAALTWAAAQRTATSPETAAELQALLADLL